MIPLNREVAALVGEWAEGVENRGLLYEKFSLPKVWIGLPKRNDAGRWSLLRIVTRGPALLERDIQRLEREARGRNVRSDVAERKMQESSVAQRMSKVARPDESLTDIASKKARCILDALDGSFRGSVATFEATLGGRLLVNLAGGVVENAGISLDRCFGMPLIPGSAVKGIARSRALWEIHEASGEEKPRLLLFAMLLFGYGAHDLRGDFGWAGGTQEAQVVAGKIGSLDFKGCACFLPAYPTTAPKLVVDMVNPHYPSYYSGRKAVAEDNENPIPNYFPAVEAGSTFGFAVLLNRVPEVEGVNASLLLVQAKQWLESAVVRKGAGAKTAAGYGWFELGRTPRNSPDSAPLGDRTPDPTATLSPLDTVIQKWSGKLGTSGNFPAALPELLALADDADLKRAFEAVIPAQERRKFRKGNPYWQSFTSSRHGDIGKKILARLNITLS